MKGKGCLIVLAVGLGLGAILAALVGPTLLREGGRFYRPIVKMQGAQKDFEAWSEAHAFKAPEKVAVDSARLDRFLALRRKLATVAEEHPLPVEQMRRKQRPGMAEIQGILEGVGGNVAGRMDAYREADMPPAEYRYLERVVYRLWLAPLRARGLDPAAVARASAELVDLAAREKDAGVARRLRDLAQGLISRRVPAPEGFPPEVHALLLSRATDIDALIDSGSSGPEAGRARIDF